MAGLDNQGLTIKRLSEIITEKKALAQSLFQDLVPSGDVVDTSDNTVLGRMIGLTAPSEADIWEAILDVYRAFDPAQATGVSLDNIVSLAGLYRLPPTASAAQCIFKGTPALVPVAVGGVTVSSPITGKKFTNSEDILNTATNASSVSVSITTAEAGNYFISYRGAGTSNLYTIVLYVSATTDEAVIRAGIAAAFTGNPDFTAQVVGTQVVLTSLDPLVPREFIKSSNLAFSEIDSIATVICTETGPFAQDSESITVIDTPIVGLVSVTNPTAGNQGSNLESDAELRMRFKEAKQKAATGTVDALYSALTQLEGMDEVAVYENDLDIVDPITSLPPHSFMCVVDGGSSIDIATTIWQKKPAGIQSVGTTTTAIIDTQGFTQNISFQRVTQVPIYIDVTVDAGTAFPGNGADLIKAALVAYINDLKVGEDVVYTRLYSPINTVPDHSITALTVDTSPSPIATANVVIALSERAFTQTSYINVTVV